MEITNEKMLNLVGREDDNMFAIHKLDPNVFQENI